MIYNLGNKYLKILQQLSAFSPLRNGLPHFSDLDALLRDPVRVDRQARRRRPREVAHMGYTVQAFEGC